MLCCVWIWDVGNVLTLRGVTKYISSTKHTLNNTSKLHCACISDELHKYISSTKHIVKKLWCAHTLCTAFRQHDPCFESSGGEGRTGWKTWREEILSLYFLKTYKEVMLMIIIVRRELNQVNWGRNVLPLYHDNGDDDDDVLRWLIKAMCFSTLSKELHISSDVLTKLEEYFWPTLYLQMEIVSLVSTMIERVFTQE